MSKPKSIVDYKKLDDGLKRWLKLTYPKGFKRNLIAFTLPNGKIISALPFETDEKIHFIKMNQDLAVKIIREDDAFGEDGVLRDEVKEEYEAGLEAYKLEYVEQVKIDAIKTAKKIEKRALEEEAKSKKKKKPKRKSTPRRSTAKKPAAKKEAAKKPAAKKDAPKKAPAKKPAAKKAAPKKKTASKK